MLANNIASLVIQCNYERLIEQLITVRTLFFENDTETDYDDACSEMFNTHYQLCQGIKSEPDHNIPLADISGFVGFYTAFSLPSKLSLAITEDTHLELLDNIIECMSSVDWYR